MIRDWFAHLPIHRKLVVMALLVTGTALVAATAGLIAFDAWRYQEAANDDIMSVAQMVADTSGAAAEFADHRQAQANVDTARLRPAVTRVCLYLTDGTLLAGYHRSRDVRCGPLPMSDVPRMAVSTTLPVRVNDKTVGEVYAERDTSDLWRRIAMTALAGAIMLLMAALLAYAVAQRVQRAVSRPIVELAAAARTIGEERRFSVPGIHAAPDEVGALVRAFTDMVDRLREATGELQHSNEALRREVEERRRIEQEREVLLVREREASRLKDEFLAAVSHELRTPLNAILGWIQILANTSPAPETAARGIATIARNAHAQSRVIEDLIDVSRIATGKLALRVEDTDLRRAAEAAVDLLRTAAAAKDIGVALTVPESACIVRGDADRLQQVVGNLLSNAVKFTPQGGHAVVTLSRVGDHCEVRVADTGIGIPPHFLAHAFDRFRQADGSLTREHGGLGLGLAIVKEITELHGGSVAAESEGPGRGATFIIRIPLAAVSSERPDVRPPADVPVPATSLAGIRVLAVDDNIDALEIISLTLTAAGAIVRLATRGADAIREWAQSSMDVLVCDLAMPDMSGFDVLNAIRAADAERGRRSPAIALSAHASKAHLDECHAAGFDLHLAKPYKADELIAAIAGLTPREKEQ